MRALQRSMLTSVWAVLVLSSGPVAGQNFLSMSDLKTLISGNTVHFEDLSNGRTGRAYHEASGQIMVERDDGAAFSGLWSVRPDGTHCMIVSNEICSKIEKNADGTYTRVIGGTPSFKWTRITPGKGF